MDDRASQCKQLHNSLFDLREPTPTCVYTPNLVPHTICRIVCMPGNTMWYLFYSRVVYYHGNHMYTSMHDQS